jgi:hypothetical protein
MTCKQAPERHCKDESEGKVITVTFTKDLATDEQLTGTPTVVEETTSDLTITNISINTIELDDKGKTIGIGKAVQFKVAGGTVAVGEEYKLYTMIINASSDSTPAQDLRGEVILKVSKD